MRTSRRAQRAHCSIWVGARALAGLLVAAWAASSPAWAVEFVRGDANSDGRVSVADAHFGFNYLFRGDVRPECGDAMDANADGRGNIQDPIYVLRHLFFGDPPPPAPFPEAGSDDADDEDVDQRLPCESYGSGSTLEDPIARMRILDVTVVGGAERQVSLVVTVSASTPLSAYQGRLDVGDVLEDRSLTEADINDGVFDLSDTFVDGFLGVHSEGGSLDFGYLSSVGLTAPIQPGEEIPALEIRLCLKTGTAAGTYPLSLVAGELVDDASSRSIMPALSSGTLTVLEDVTDDECVIEPSNPFVRPDFDVEFRLGEVVDAVPSTTIAVPFYLTTGGPAQGVRFAVFYDRDVLEFIDIEPVWRRPDGAAVKIFPRMRTSDDGEPYLVGIVAFTELPLDNENVPPIDAPTHVLDLLFRVAPDAGVGSTELHFGGDGSVCRECSSENYVTSRGQSLPARIFDSFVFVDGRVTIIGEVTTFIRADSNNDGLVDVSDARFTLNHLFLGGRAPTCMDAADANDDGVVDISDASNTLNVLFLGFGSVPPPNEVPAEDPTPDGLSCRFGTSR